ncbi:MAG TPA: DUF4147 domain-containing protein, partial [bacterium]|nr:DUF4147 domain-containing protein [bacterium]
MAEDALSGNAAKRLPIVFRETLALCDPELLTGAALVRDGESLEVHRHVYTTTQDAAGRPRAKLAGRGAQLGISLGGGRVALLAAGKAAAGMARAVHAALGDRLGPTLVVLPPGAAAPTLRDAEILRAEHPIPGAGSVAAAERVLSLAASLAPEDLLVVALSGGASALLSAPAQGLTLDDKIGTTRALLAGGADIRAINAVRKHLSRIKGGRLAAATR